MLLQVPVISNALGGILVGLVTSHAGGVRKVKTKQKKSPKSKILQLLAEIQNVFFVCFPGICDCLGVACDGVTSVCV